MNKFLLNYEKILLLILCKSCKIPSIYSVLIKHIIAFNITKTSKQIGGIVYQSQLTVNLGYISGGFPDEHYS